MATEREAITSYPMTAELTDRAVIAVSGPEARAFLQGLITNDVKSIAHDVLRHTFISMFVGKYRSMGEAALQAGNSESIIRKHYLDLKSTAEAEQFFGILPQHTAPAAVVTPFVAAPAQHGAAQAKPAA